MSQGTQVATPEAPAATEVDVAGSERGKHLVFALTPNDYAVPIRAVREIIAMHDITPLPGMPEFVRGVINLRGRIIPVADLCIRLGLGPHEETPVSCIIVADLACGGDGPPSEVGCIVDSVREVREIRDDQIQETPRGGDEAHVHGLVRTDDEVIAVLDLEVLLGDISSDEEEQA